MSEQKTFIYLDLGVIVVELSPTEWRVTDTRRSDDADSPSPIGFIQQTASGFDTTEPGAPGRRTRFLTFPEALTSLSRRRRSDLTDPQP